MLPDPELGRDVLGPILTTRVVDSERSLAVKESR